MAAQSNLVRVQEHGQVTLPANVRKLLGLEELYREQYAATEPDRFNSLP